MMIVISLLSPPLTSVRVGWEKERVSFDLVPNMLESVGEQKFITLSDSVYSIPTNILLHAAVSLPYFVLSL